MATFEKKKKKKKRVKFPCAEVNINRSKVPVYFVDSALGGNVGNSQHDEVAV